MKVHKGYKFKLEPTEEQKIKINKTLGCCRFVYNSMLDRRIKTYKRRGESMSYMQHHRKRRGFMGPPHTGFHDRRNGRGFGRDYPVYGPYV